MPRSSNFDFSNPIGALGAIHSSTEIYDPVTNTWSSGPGLPNPRVAHSATLMGDGRVLITGGISVTFLILVDFTEDCRIYNPAPALSVAPWFRSC